MKNKTLTITVENPLQNHHFIIQEGGQPLRMNVTNDLAVMMTLKKTGLHVQLAKKEINGKGLILS